MKQVEVKGEGWTDLPEATEPLQLLPVRVELSPIRAGLRAGSTLLDVTVADQSGALVQTRVRAYLLSRPRALRRLATFHRAQPVFADVLGIEDELRAMSVLGRTLEQLPEEARERTVAWLMDRFRPAPQEGVTERIRLSRREAAEGPAPSEAESLSIAKARVLA